ncbi:hypothetical protein JCM3765_002142 [Sporobolomyces pararoseus]
MSDDTTTNWDANSPIISEEQAESTAVRITCDFEFNASEYVKKEILLKTRSEDEWKILFSRTDSLATLELSPVSQSTKDLARANLSVWFCVRQRYGYGREEWSHRLDEQDLRLGLDSSVLLFREKDICEEYSNDASFKPLPIRCRVIVEYRLIRSSEYAGSRFETVTAPRNSQMYLYPFSTNVALSFNGGRRLWIDSSLLCSLSDYFSICLSSDFAESKIHSTESGRAVEDVLEPIKKKQKTEEEFEDSDDDEGDQDPEHTASSTLSNGSSLSFQEITISHAAFVTYRALLVWNQTGFLRFAPLTSSFLTFNSYQPIVDLAEAQKLRQQVIEKLIADDSSLPHPVSPKSMYRLAAFLDLEDLKKRSLSAYFQRLTTQGAIHELLSKESSCYPDLRDATLKYIGSNSQIILKSASYDYLYQQLHSGSLRDPTIFAELFEAVSLSRSESPGPFRARYSNDRGSRGYDHGSIDGVYFP